ncbi:MAG: methyl-accepting chemotaxis protein [Chloroflexota bacterium]
MKVQSLRARVTVVFVLFVTLITAEIGAIVVLTERVDTAANVVEVASVQRGRSQRMAKDILLLVRAEDSTARASLEQVSSDFDRALAALIDGGVAPIATGSISLPPATGVIASQLAGVREQWVAFQAATTAVLEEGRGTTGFDAAVEAVVRTNTRFLDDLQAVVDAASGDLEAGLGLLRLITIGVPGLTLLVIGGAWFWIGRQVVRPVEDLARATRRIAGGDLSEHLDPGRRTDEIGALAGAFGEMTESLRANLRSQGEAVASLGSASAEILAAVNQLTAGATEESAAVAQIGTTVEEVRATAEEASERARAVAEAAARSSDVAIEGQSAVGTARQGMMDLSAKVDTIAQRILALSEQTQAIGEIVTTVADLADQSNLLAVNAAIEAAKAGEQGRGFAVVAQEVRNLADQSREATAQVSGILGEIQKAANSAVLVTEQGTRDVATAVEKVELAGAVIDQLAATAAEAAGLARQIAASAGQQRVGVDQIGSGIANVGQVSNQTVAAARQLQQEAEGLTRLADHLEGLTRRFVLSGEPVRPGDEARAGGPPR